jgi:putative ATP-dependent endonuclease of OLD family
MRVSAIHIENYRLLKNFLINLDDDSNFTMCVGKNNSGKTSFLNILEQALCVGMKDVSYEDFSLETRASILALLASKKTKPADLNVLTDELAIKIAFTIDYSSVDSDLSLVPLLSLDEKQSRVDVKIFKYFDPDKIEDLRKHFKQDGDSYASLAHFLERNAKQYMRINCVASSEDGAEVVDDRQEGFDLFFGVTQSIRFYKIDARRNVANSPEFSRQGTLSRYAQEFMKTGDGGPTDELKLLNAAIAQTDTQLTSSYNDPDNGIFKQIIDDIGEFIPSLAGDNIKVRSTLSRGSILGYNNTKIFYGEDESSLPEGHSGLGYMNMYAMIIKLRTIVNEIKAKPSNVIANLLFIEEPEAHTHPQMQYVFAQRIKEFLTKSGVDRLQTIVTTHSPHIVSQFNHEDDIVYFVRKNGTNDIEGRRIKDFYGSSSYKNFLKQYLTVHRAELFFADKIIFVEGDTERILLPYFMRLLDQNETKVNLLLGQYISIVDVGNFTHIFKEFIEMLGVKTLVITDLDANNGAKCDVKDGTKTTNSSLNVYFQGTDFKDLITLSADKKVLSIKEGVLKQDKAGLLRVAYQTEEAGYHARSFEDSFLSLNKKFLTDNKQYFKESTSYTKLSETMTIDYAAAETYGVQKALFAIDIINTPSDEVVIPDYIKAGLKWLAS